ncbi:hypothetical protein [Clostridium beijerinckii]|uniref:Uncharacterized protein n=2 Tax=Clostridium beijerinckii TaxID=1520 RepID=A0AAW3W541_CLOBE|nr:hypothetical protein [Clostridium beijerinckii]ALB44994.1 hypothetical protein X276_06765 [Clostridium beijerinckii NRRL B-598]MBC2456751.1 hypothetical protein [Clostridium beijerinckii]MBC2474051.1 hypothetical protein [Clostridium beijerinckii]MDG5853581.1 hypothetical protein [Clostridium beijerinckii]NOV61407.1 hypothetical protein [Clostridium beijerinckii]
MKRKLPMIVMFIGDMSLLYVALIIISISPMKSIMENIGVYPIPMYNFLDGALRVLSAIVLLTIAYGYFKLKKWAYLEIIIYNVFFLAVSMFFIAMKTSNPYNTPNIIESLLGLIIAFPSKRYFFKEECDS